MSEPLSLVAELATVPDPRSRKGRRHPLTAILSLTAVAILAGRKSRDAIAQFGRDHGPPRPRPRLHPWQDPLHELPQQALPPPRHRRLGGGPGPLGPRPRPPPRLGRYRPRGQDGTRVGRRRRPRRPPADGLGPGRRRRAQAAAGGRPDERAQGGPDGARGAARAGQGGDWGRPVHAPRRGRGDPPPGRRLPPDRQGQPAGVAGPDPGRVARRRGLFPPPSGSRRRPRSRRPGRRTRGTGGGSTGG
jgi:hypothetical protein